MKIELLVVGKTRQDYLAAGIEDYQQRLRPYCSLSIKVVKEKRGRLPDNARLREEGEKLLSLVPKGALLVVLDPGGRRLSSEELAFDVGRWRDMGKQLISFVVGGPLGLSDEVRRRAEVTISLSRMTFTHEMARLLFLEQLYRAFTILAGSKYHK
ncbi:23S rRNA (pseudouridine(1915)-N(3))-methyltransferase [hydrothermal vent metagenome]|uniref:23S rRNA (Pseudouridine(1915)-N(3))-methyltransferase n=1 Tax=hydrothermal vent metagenome TaxID=652676 RepID=A0A3B0V8X8_9ZZZZ